MGTRDGLDAVTKKNSVANAGKFTDTDTNSRYGKLPLAFASTVILGFGYRGTLDHIFLSRDSH
jgi:hypothetical protein